MTSTRTDATEPGPSHGSDAASALREAWVAAGGDEARCDGVTFTRPGEHLPSVFAVGVLSQAAIAAATLAVAEAAGIDGPGQPVVVDGLHAAVAFRSEAHVRVDGRSESPWDPLAGDYPADDGWVRLHTNYPHHRAAALRALGLGADADRDAVAAAVRRWQAVDLEEAVIAEAGCAAAMRDVATWQAHPHGRLLLDAPPVHVAPADHAEAVGAEARARRVVPRRDHDGPLAGLRVLDCTRVIAGPVCTRLLAGYGAEVLRIDPVGFDDVAPLVADTTVGKRTCRLDLHAVADRAQFEALVAGADVLVHGYRPGALDGLGYDDGVLAQLRPGLVTARLSAYGVAGAGGPGPWSGRRGFDSLVQMVAGVAHAGMVAAGADAPRPLPAQALDHASGYLLASGTLRALTETRWTGVPHTAEVSLAATAAWLERLGRVDALDRPWPAGSDLAALACRFDADGHLVELTRAPGRIGDHVPTWSTPPRGLGADQPVWLSD